MQFTSTYVPIGFNIHNLNNFSPLGQCDLSRFPVQYKNLVPQMEWGGNKLYNTGFMVDKRMVPIPNPGMKTPPIFMDPEPVMNPRPILSNTNTWV